MMASHGSSKIVHNGIDSWRMLMAIVDRYNYQTRLLRDDYCLLLVGLEFDVTTGCQLWLLIKYDDQLNDNQ